MTASLVLALSFSTVLGATPFEGELTFKLGGTTAQGSVRLELGAQGLRSDLTGQLMNRPFESGLLARLDGGGLAYALDPVRKSWLAFDTAEAAAAFRTARRGTLKVERLGTERVMGFSCQHVRVSDGGSFEGEYWVTTELLDGALVRLVNSTARQPASVEAALKDAGLAGLILKLAQRQGNELVTLELEKAVAKSVPSERFRLPSDYAPAPSQLGGGVTLASLAKFESLSEADRKALVTEMRANAERAARH